MAGAKYINHRDYEENEDLIGISFYVTNALYKVQKCLVIITHLFFLLQNIPIQAAVS